MKKQIFIDKELQKEFDEKGYVIVPLLGENHIADCNNVFQNLSSGVNRNFYTTIWSDDKVYRKQVDQSLKHVLVEPLRKYLKDCKSVFANYMVKQPGSNSSLDLHQDWTFVDENTYDSITVWIPLVKTTPINGSLKVVSASHKFDIPIRGRGIKSPFDGLKEFIKESYLTNINNNAGEAVIFNSRIFHCSFDNLSGQERIAVSIVMAPREAQLIHFVKQSESDNGKIEQLNVDEEFYTNFGLDEDLQSVTDRQSVNYRDWELTLKAFDHGYSTFNR